MPEVTTTFEATGTVQDYVVPVGVVAVVVECWGSQGGSVPDIGATGAGGLGGYATGVLTVTPGETLKVYVGKTGAQSIAGFNGGGNGRGQGGGASDIRQGGTGLDKRKIVAGGGGGGGYQGGAGGNGGGTSGSAGTTNPAVGGNLHGGGASSSAGGTAGGGTGGAAGVSGQGASGAFYAAGNVFAGGGGGGGYFGGGAGGYFVSTLLYGGGGGGGSSYVGGVVGGSTTAGLRTGAGQVKITTTNAAPDAPALLTMTDTVIIDRAAPQRAKHQFSDPTPGDSQSAFDIRWRLVGATSWSTAYAATPNQWYDFPAGTFDAGNYERQVRTYDQEPLVGPWCASGFFTAQDPPDGPAITAPINEGTVSSSATLMWSTPAQDAYQVRRVADDAGDPDTGVVYFDTGEVTDGLTRSLDVEFETNDRFEHLQVRVKFETLWSSWISVRVEVSYAAPPVPSYSINIDPATASLLVLITNPAPTGGDPAASYNDVYIDDGPGEERKATAVAPNGSYRYMTPVSGRDYAFAVRVVAVAANGTASSSAA